MKIKYPDYNSSILSVASSVLAHYGAPANHKTLPQLDELLSKNYKNVVVMLFDGMGTAILEKHLDENAFFRRNLRGVISSVFPPTTTAATMSIETGLSPIEHAWLGWSLYFCEIDANVSIFPNTLSGSGGVPAADYHVAARYIPQKDIFEKIKEATNGGVKAVRVSSFSDYHSQSSAEICDTVKALCAEDGRKYIYTYWYKPDYDMHDLGTAHETVTADIKQFNDETEEMCRGLHDTLVIITADHGLVDTEWRFISDYPDVDVCLARKPSIESRAMTFFIKDGMQRQFETAFTKHFGGCYILLSRNEVFKKGLFGGGTPHPKSLDFIGDYLAVAKGSISIDYAPSAQHDLFKAAHAGMTEDEMNVPFIVIECK
jgi:hypothetical protein